MGSEFEKQLQANVNAMSSLERKQFIDRTPNHLRVNLKDPTRSWDDLLALAVKTRALIIKNDIPDMGPKIPESTLIRFIEDAISVSLKSEYKTPQQQRYFIDSTEIKLKLKFRNPTTSFESQINLAIKTRMLLNEIGTIHS